LSCAVAALQPGALAYGALLSPQGKILSDMMIFCDADTLALDVPQSALADLMRRLSLYKLRAAVTLEESEEAVAVTFADLPGARPDPRGAGLGSRLLVPPAEAPDDPADSSAPADVLRA
jgi:folate-binding Fe-S cluster repair protein YgfZ